MNEFNYIFDKQVVEAMKNSDKKYLIEIDQRVQALPFGRLDFSLRIHEGKVTDIIFVTNQRIRMTIKEGLTEKKNDDIADM
jgi:hypothetical protein